MNFLRFLFILQKIMIFIVLIIFIPNTILVFAGEQVIVKPQFQQFYQNSLQSCYQKTTNCTKMFSQIGYSLSGKYHENYVDYRSASTSLFYFALLPLVILVAILFFVDLCSKHNFRLANSLALIPQVMVGIGIIVKGYLFNEANENMNDKLNQISIQCFDTTTTCFQTFQAHMRSFQGYDNISTAFTFFMILLLVIQVLCLVIVFILNILMQQYYKAKDIEPHSSQDYELQHF